MSQILKKYPKATAYMLGAFDASPSNMDVLLHNTKLKELVEELEQLIKSKHPEWKRDEIYCRGLDLKETADDVFKEFEGKTQAEKIPKMKAVIQKLGHSERVVLVTCQIGHIVYEVENDEFGD